MFNFQRRRFFPLPEYDIKRNRVKVTIIGKVLDLEYAKVLSQAKNLTLEEIMMLDKVQKKKPLSAPEIKHLRNKQLIEGVKPNYFISASLAKQIGQKAEYTKAKGLDKQKYFELIINCIEQHNSVNRKDINNLLWDVLPVWMDESQKRNKINHLLSQLRSNGKIRNVGNDFKPQWVLASNSEGF